MADPSVTSPILVRGPLRYVVETSSPQLEAGKKFSVSVRITNPYNVPVVIRSVLTKLPAKFFSPSETGRKGFWKEGEDLLKAMVQAKSLRPLLEVPGGQVVQAAGPAGVPAEDAGVELQSGNSTVKVFAVRTTSATFFVPSLYNLNLEIEYEMDGKMNHDTVGYQMNVRAPLKAIIYGSVIGSIIGYLVKEGMADTTQFQRTPFWLRMLKAVLVSGIVVVAFARKKDAQPVLSIEDFWGGVFVGFLSAYGGESLLHQFTGESAKP